MTMFSLGRNQWDVARPKLTAYCFLIYSFNNVWYNYTFEVAVPLKLKRESKTTKFFNCNAPEYNFLLYKSTKF